MVAGWRANAIIGPGVIEARPMKTNLLAICVMGAAFALAACNDEADATKTCQDAIKAGLSMPATMRIIGSDVIKFAHGHEVSVGYEAADDMNVMRATQRKCLVHQGKIVDHYDYLRLGRLSPDAEEAFSRLREVGAEIGALESKIETLKAERARFWDDMRKAGSFTPESSRLIQRRDEVDRDIREATDMVPALNERRETLLKRLEGTNRRSP